MVTLMVGIFLVLLLLALAVWQSKISDREHEEALADEFEAKKRGTDRAIAQFPQIDLQTCIGCGSCVVACPENDVLRIVEGVAKVIHGSRCIGHGHCAVACPVSAIEVGLGDIGSRPDIPVLSDSMETSRRGVYIAGELGGLALIRIAIEQGKRVIDSLGADLPPGSQSSDADLYDVLIVGAGPAGLSASLRAKQRGLRFLTIDQDDIGGTVRKYPRQKLTLTGTMDLPLHGPIEGEEFVKEELISLWEEIIKRHQLNIRTGVKFQGLEGDCDDFRAQTSEGEVRARRVVMAIGKRGTPRRLGVPGEDLEKVLYQLKDAASYEDKRILVVGGGDSAIEAAMALANQSGNDVTLSYRGENLFRLKPRNAERIDHYRHRLRLVLNSTLTSVDKHFVSLSCLEEDEPTTMKVENDFVFVFAGGEPPYALLQGMGIRFGGDEAPLFAEDSFSPVGTESPESGS